MKGTPIERFEYYAHKIPFHECWEWCGSLRPQVKLKGDGYGAMKVGDRIQGAHRFAYEHFVGPIPSGLHVLHTCDNPSCVNPNHLFLGTHADNMADMKTKGRANPWPGVRALQKLERTLRFHDVRWIRKAYAARILNQYELAAKFSVSQPAISYIVRGLHRPK